MRAASALALARRGVFAAVVALCSAIPVQGQSNFAATLTIQVDQPGVPINSNLFGIFFEEINSAGDGGLYAELVRNRSFEDSSTTPTNWTLVTTGSAAGSMSLDTSLPLGATNLQSLKLSMTGGSGTVGTANSGYWGMAVTQAATYNLGFYARCSAGFTGPIAVALESANGSIVYAQATLGGLTTNWQHFGVALIPILGNPSARLALRMSQAGTVWLDFVSLFPQQTFNHRTNGLRPDLMNALVGLRPSFVRFPGGSWVDGTSLANAYHWKPTIGDPATRPVRANIWGYMVDNGLGYHEYLQMCEDLRAEPLFVINCGMDFSQNAVPTSQMASWVQEALDAIEYANGDVNTAWGGQRVANGHPAPFNLKYMEIGNENNGAAYNDRYALFYDAIKAQYPQMHLVADSFGTIPTSRPVEILDEHYYSDPGFFIANATRYDGYSRSGPRIYVGEYAVTSGSGNGNLAAALGEAAFMTGLERNADVVCMASYAPLFANLNNKNWNPDLIYFNGTQVYGTPSYYVQQLFSLNRGDVVLPAVLALTNNTSLPHGAVGLGSWNTQVQYTNLVVASNGVTLYQSDFTSGASGWTVYNGSWSTSGGLYQQTALAIDCRSTTGDTNWGSYTLTLRARKTGGSEGFLILVNWRDNNNWTWWNIGGWNNTQHAIEQMINGAKSLIGQPVPGSVQTGRWYDIRIVLSGLRMQCFLDGQLIHDVTYPTVQSLLASASYAAASGQVILKAVNVSGGPITTALNLNGLPSVAPQASLAQLTSASPLDENSLAQPTRVAPVAGTITNAGTNFSYTFPANSLSIIRLQTPPALPTVVNLDAATNLNYLASSSSGIPVGLSSFITNTVSVNFEVEAADGSLVTNGTLQLIPGTLTANIPLPPSALQAGAFFRVTLSNPVNCQLGDLARAYFAVASSPGDPLRLGLASFADEDLVYWTDPTATLLEASDASGPWMSVTNALCPIRVPGTAASEFLRLMR